MHYFSICTTEALISSRTKSILEPNILCENRSNRTFRSYHGQGPPCSDKGRCRCALSNLNIAMEYTVKAFSSGLSQPATDLPRAASRLAIYAHARR